MHQIAPIPSGFEPFVYEADLGLVLFEDVQGELPDEREVLCCHFASFALLVFAEGHVERPVELVLDLPVVADVGVEAAVCRQAADIVAHLAGLLAAGAACRLDPDDGLQLRPVLVVHSYDGVGFERMAEPDLYPTVPLVHVRVLG